MRLIFVAAIDYENIFTTKISRFTVDGSCRWCIQKHSSADYGQHPDHYEMLHDLEIVSNILLQLYGTWLRGCMSSLSTKKLQNCNHP